MSVTDRWFDTAERADFQSPAALLKKLGFAGMVLRGDAGDLRERLAELKKQGLDVPALVVSGAPGVSLGGVLELLKGSRARIWMSLEMPGRTPSDPGGDPAAAEYLGVCAELCRKAGLPGIGLLPRPGAWLAKISDARRMAERIDRPEVGMIFDLHTWMTEAPGGDPRRALDAMRSHLVGVLVNGSGQLPSVLPLCEGEFDAGPVVRALVDLKYDGPVVFAAPERPGRTPELLEASLRKWEVLRKAAREEPPQTVRAHVYISGTVQGVSFRASTQSEALRLKVVGWVRNLDDGRVEAMFEGLREPVAELLLWCHTGPPAARVQKVDVTWEKPEGTFRTFEFRR